MTLPPSTPAPAPSTPAPATGETSTGVVFRIGEVAKLTGLTTRTLRYWEEIGLVSPSSHGSSGDRQYTAPEMNRVTRIRDLQKLLGFSLAEVRVVLDTEEVDVLDRVRSELHSGDPSPRRQRELIEEAIAANDQLLARLDDTLAHIDAFRVERRTVAARLTDRLRALDGQPENPEKVSSR
jgi:MerR family transcriptional regulator, thiopeptide resistance regulator